MNAEVLLKYFDRISDAPDAVPRLRQFVLELAVRGKLLAQDSNAEPASALLKRIEAEAVRFGGVKKNARQPHIAPLPSGSAPFEIPTQWIWLPLTSIGFTQTGTTPPSSNQEYFGDFIPFITPADLTGRTINYSGRALSKSGVEHSRLIRKHSALMVCIGSSIGKVNVTDRDICCNQQINAVTPFLEDLTEFISYALTASYFQNLVLANAGLGTLPIISKGKWEVLPLPLPPVAEQRRIVAKVEELQTLCDRLEQAQKEREARRNRLTAASLHELNNCTERDELREQARFFINHLPSLTARSEQLTHLRQSVLNLAVRGKLVPQCTDDEPASTLLNRIRTEQDSATTVVSRRRRAPSLSPVDVSLAPFAIPSNWTWARFPELGMFGRGKSKHRPRNDQALFDGGTHPLIQTGDVARSRGVIETYTGKYNDLGLAQSQMWPAGTLCITIAANIADSGILSFDACFPDSVVGFLPASVFPNARYLEYFVRTAKGNLLEFAPATAQKNINLEILNAVLIPLPPLAEQQRIVARVDELMALCDRLDVQLRVARTECNGLLEAVLHRALLGKDEDRLQSGEQRVNGIQADAPNDCLADATA